MNPILSETMKKVAAIHKAIDRVALQIDALESQINRDVEFQLHVSKPRRDYTTYEYVASASATVKINLRDDG